jgi:hypothetical protein
MNKLAQAGVGRAAISNPQIDPPRAADAERAAQPTKGGNAVLCAGQGRRRLADAGKEEKAT